MSKLEDKLAASLKIGGNADAKAGARKNSPARPLVAKPGPAKAPAATAMTRTDPVAPSGQIEPAVTAAAAQPGQASQVSRSRDLHSHRVWPD